MRKTSHALTVTILSFMGLFLASPSAHADCPAGNQIFSHLMYDSSKISLIIPLGDMGPPEHTLPVHHLYYQTLPDGMGGYQFTGVRSPADMRIVAIEDQYPQDPNGPNDYALHLRPVHNGTICEDIRLYIRHLEYLDADILTAIGGMDEDNDPGVAAIGNRIFKFGLNIAVSAGDTLGQSGGVHPNFDIGLIDRRLPAVGFVKPERYDPAPVIAGLLPLQTDPDVTAQGVWDIMPDRNYQRCAVDYFSSALKQTQESLFASPSGLAADGVPICQTQMRDAAGTLSGNWYHDPYVDYTDSQLLYYEGDTLAIGPYNIAPTSRHILSVNHAVFQTAMPNPAPPYDNYPYLGGAYYYTPYGAGSLVNPKATDTTAGPVYCFERVVWNETTLLSGVFLAQLDQNDALSVEFVPGAPLCSMHTGYPNFTLNNSKTYYR